MSSHFTRSISSPLRFSSFWRAGDSVAQLVCYASGEAVGGTSIMATLHLIVPSRLACWRAS